MCKIYYFSISRYNPFVIYLTSHVNSNTTTMKINRLKVLLTEKDKTSRWLAEQLGKTEVTVSRWCTNEVQPSVETLLEIANLLDVDIKELINSSKF